MGVLLGVNVLPAEAGPITGGFSITGNFLPVNGVTGAVTSLSQATGIDFLALFGSTPTPGTAGQFLVNSAAGDFGGLLGGLGTIRDISFAGPGSGNFPNPNVVGPLLAFQNVLGTTFTLTSVGPASVQSFGSLSFLTFTGQGYFSMAGFSNTNGTFGFTGNGAGGTFSFSASNVTVPEPASAALLGSGLVMLFGLRNRRRKTA
ncbi:MAG TPA: PEP-CTERM sorting domain-containing protein [Vicinamibacterales bacterium]|nr:PEP-CTERM sorting domain-containing protein [Vicinamibacterales bacterium]